jgi:16S rRNA (cytosine967-C5)-methyltransferase
MSVAERTKWAPGAEALAAAAQAVARVTVHGRTTDDAFASFERSDDRATIRAIALGTLRWYLRLAPAIDSLLTNPDKLPPDLRALLISAAHQIEYSRNAPQASVHIAVDAARALGHPRTTGVVNAVLRRFVAERDPLLARIDNKPSRRTAHPDWLFKALRNQWPEQTESILAANNAHPPMVLRVDTARIDVPSYLAKLASAGIAAHAIEWTSQAVELEKPVSVSALPGFAEGLASVQDAGAQLAAVLLDAQPGMRVLDACAAPGGKTGHILQHTSNLAEVVALDIDAERLKRVEENLSRLNVQATLVAADLRAWDSEPFDRILVDAPCSSTGVIRRHPDIKLLRRATDIPSLTNVQLEIVRAAFRLLKPGGRLLYATCSVLKEENELTLKNFLGAEPSASHIELSPGKDLAPGAISQSIGVQLLPGAAAGTDGFYYACVEKTTPEPPEPK